MCLAVALLAVHAGPAAAQDGSGSAVPPDGVRAEDALVEGRRAGGLLRASATRLLASAARGGLGGERRSAAGPAATVRGPSGSGEALAGGASLFRAPTALERGWRLVGSGTLDAGEADDGSEADAWVTGGTEETGEGDGEPPFLVRLFDAREVMLWIRDAREWGEEARRVVFGPRGIVRAGSVPGSDRPRVRLELTDSRPGARVVIITR